MTEIVRNPEVVRLLDELTRMEGREDPYPRYARLREISPIVRAEDGALVVTGYDECATVLRDPRLGHLPTDVLTEVFPEWRDHAALRMLYTSMLTINPPDHTRLRRLVSSAFTARRVQSLRASIEAMVDDLRERLAGESDFIAAFAFPLPVNVIGELLGVPAADRAPFQTLVRDWTQILEQARPEVLGEADAAAETMYAYLGELLVERREHPADDLLSALAAASTDGDRLSDDEAVTTAALLFAAGFETTTNLLANGLAALLVHPGQYRLLAERPDLAPTAVEELLRYDSPVQISTRLVAAPIELAGVPLPAGERVVAYLGAGNRDPRRFAEPDRLDVERTGGAPLSFGGGIHYCLGAPLARLEAQVAFPALARRFPALAPSGAPERRDSLSLKGYLCLPIRGE